ncbi:MAG: hypothetical protein FIA96_03380 [Betaproteobacteria bacterium]|nr:hypothetical protein [Betaproteobacteria bacterium]
MSKIFLRMLFAVLTPLSIGGCASMQAPTGSEISYPNSWPELEGLGAECKDIEGGYEGDGVFIDADGVQNQLSIIDLFSLRKNNRVGVVHLAVTTSRKDPNEDTIGSLQVIADGDKDNARRYDSFCIRNILFFVASAGGGVIRPVVWGNQQNVWLGRGFDGSLIAKIGKYTAGAVGFVPFYSEMVGWARFFKKPCDSTSGCFEATPASRQPQAK